MPKLDDETRMWAPGAGFAPKVTPRPDDPHTIEVDADTDPRDVMPGIADALAIGEEAIVLGRVGGTRSLICRALPLRRGVFLITKDQRGTGLRPHVGAALADAARAIAAEFEPRG